VTSSLSGTRSNQLSYEPESTGFKLSSGDKKATGDRGGYREFRLTTRGSYADDQITKMSSLLVSLVPPQWRKNQKACPTAHAVAAQ
jgi:hypothetical protein